jgi:hypothetical protein
MLRRAGWYLVRGAGKGSHTKWKHDRVARKVTLSGNDGSDATKDQEVDVQDAVDQGMKNDQEQK